MDLIGRVFQCHPQVLHSRYFPKETLFFGTLGKSPFIVPVSLWRLSKQWLFGWDVNDFLQLSTTPESHTDKILIENLSVHLAAEKSEKKKTNSECYENLIWWSRFSKESPSFQHLLTLRCFLSHIKHFPPSIPTPALSELVEMDFNIDWRVHVSADKINRMPF